MRPSYLVAYEPREFAKMVSTFGGWGMRIGFVPDDELHDEPVVEVREPDPRPRCAHRNRHEIDHATHDGCGTWAANVHAVAPPLN
jgi:hypothetical protein